MPVSCIYIKKEAKLFHINDRVLKSLVLKGEEKKMFSL